MERRDRRRWGWVTGWGLGFAVGGCFGLLRVLAWAAVKWIFILAMAGFFALAIVIAAKACAQ